MSNKVENKLIISDPTLRDGNHAVRHQLSINDIRTYAKGIDDAGIDIVEVGHGNGLGASSLQLGEACVSDIDALKAARAELKRTKLGVHIIPGFGRIDAHLKLAIDEGVDVVRVASHCTEADTTKNHISFAKNKGVEVVGVLMMSHMASKDILLTEAKKMYQYGAEAIVIMDSAGYYLPVDVTERVSHLVENLSIPVGFHAHNNLCMAVSNSISAVEAGASIVDATICGFGAGAGNTPLEVLVAVLQKKGISRSVNLSQLLKVAALSTATFVKERPTTNEISLMSGLHGVFSGFSIPVKKAAEAFNVDAMEIFRLLGEKKVVAGQEDLIIEVAKTLKSNKEKDL